MVMTSHDVILGRRYLPYYVKPVLDPHWPKMVAFATYLDLSRTIPQKKIELGIPEGWRARRATGDRRSTGEAARAGAAMPRVCCPQRAPGTPLPGSE